jgi:hypothetical protein
MEKLTKTEALKYFSKNYNGYDHDVAFDSMVKIIDSEDEEFEKEYIDDLIFECENFKEDDSIMEITIK